MMRGMIVLMCCLIFMTGCRDRIVGLDEIISSLQSSGYDARKGPKIHHSIVGAQLGYWIKIDGVQVSAFQFGSREKAQLKAKMLRNGFYANYWVFEFTDPRTQEKIQQAFKSL